MDIGARIKQLRERRGLTLEQVGEYVGVNKATVQRYETGEIDIKRNVAIKLAEVLHAEPAYIMGWTDTPVSTPIEVVRIFVLGTIPAGIPIEAIEDIVDWEEIPAAMCSGGREYFGLRVRGDSMYPEYMEGDTIIVRKTQAFESGDVCVVYVNGYDATLKRVKVGEDGSWTLTPRNPEYSPKTYSIQDIQTVPVSIAGVVVELRRKVR